MNLTSQNKAVTHGGAAKQLLFFFFIVSLHLKTPFALDTVDDSVKANIVTVFLPKGYAVLR